MEVLLPLTFAFTSLMSVPSLANPSPATGSKTTTLRLGASGVFGSLQLNTNRNAGTAKWRDVMRRTAADLDRLKRCETSSSGCTGQVRKWQEMTAAARSAANARDRLALVNRAINRMIPYGDDGKVFGKKDFWASPLQAIGRGGDCEDYVIAKYAALEALGFKPAQMKLVVVEHMRRRIGHAVLAVEQDGETYILDNLSRDLRTQGQITWYKPAYSLSGDRSWINVAVKIKAPQQVANNVALDALAADNGTPPLPMPKPKPSLKGPVFDDDGTAAKVQLIKDDGAVPLKATDLALRPSI